MSRSAVTAAVLGLVLVAAPAHAGSGVPAEDTGPPLSDRTAGPEVRVLVPARLKRGPDARLDHLQDGVIRTAAGRRIRVRVPHDPGTQHLLGRAGKDYVVASRKGRDRRVHLVRAGRAPRPLLRSRGGATFRPPWIGFRLSRDGRMLVRTTNDGYYTSLAAFDVRTSERLGGRSGEDVEEPLDADAGRVLLNGVGPTRLLSWTPGTAPVIVTRRASAVFADRDLAFVRTRGRRSGPTSLSSPGVPAWGAPFRPLDVSPDGSLVVGASLRPDPADRRRQVLELRRMSDGAVLRAFRYGGRFGPPGSGDDTERTARFEDDRRFVFEVRPRRRSVLVRCNLGGRCVRASGSGGAISVPHEGFFE